MRIRPCSPSLFRYVCFACFSVIALLIALATSSVAGVPDSPPKMAQAENSAPLYPPTRRFGVGVATRYGDIGEYDIASWNLGWYSDWSMRYEPPEPWGIEYVQLVPIPPYPPNWEHLGAMLAHNPGSLWIVGNEPECPFVGNLRPEQYAMMYHHIYYFIKEHDPTARVAIGGVVEPTPLRLAWLDATLAEYEAMFREPMPVEVWNIHVQILQEKMGAWGCGTPVGIPDQGRARLYSIYDNANADAFVQLVREFCAWLVAKGERDKPLIIAEYGVLLPSDILGDGDAARGDLMVKAFMRRTFHFLLTAKDPQLGYAEDEHRLVQRWLWYSLNDKLNTPESPSGFNGSLFDWRDPSRPTTFGETFDIYMATLQGKRISLPLVSRGG